MIFDEKTLTIRDFFYFVTNSQLNLTKIEVSYIVWLVDILTAIYAYPRSFI